MVKGWTVHLLPGRQRETLGGSIRPWVGSVRFFSPRVQTSLLFFCLLPFFFSIFFSFWERHQICLHMYIHTYSRRSFTFYKQAVGIQGFIHRWTAAQLNRLFNLGTSGYNLYQYPSLSISSKSFWHLYSFCPSVSPHPTSYLSCPKARRILPNYNSYLPA